jgi:hypothetical protein
VTAGNPGNPGNPGKRTKDSFFETQPPKGVDGEKTEFFRQDFTGLTEF